MSGYWQIPIHDDSTDLLTFGTIYGRYKFLRMPFGIHSASEIFQREVGKIVEGLDGVSHLQDDIIIHAETKKVHDERVMVVMERIRDSGMKLNKSKCSFGVSEVSFLGHLISESGIKVDPKKVEAITHMPIPSNKTELQRFLGMINYLGKFIPNLAQETAPLRLLLKKETMYVMQGPQIEAIKKLKSLVTDSPVRKFYNPNAPIRLRTDASIEGLGAMIEQKFDGQWHPIAYGSRSLGPSERNYAPIERETLSVVFGCTHFHEFLYGHTFVVKNDHQPLKTIFTKSIIECPPRIQRFFMALQKYDFKVEYEPGKYMVVSDALSRASLDEKTPEVSLNDMTHHVHCIMSNLPVSQSRLIQIQRETMKDETLQQVKQCVLNGWPPKTQVNQQIAPYYKYRDEIVYNHDVLLKGQRIIIPASLREEIKYLIHQGHLGIEACKRRCRQSVFWPFINQEITNMVENCSNCLKYRRKQSKEPFIPHEVPTAPWLKVATDLFTIHNKNYVVVVDYFSKYFEVAALGDPADSVSVINALKRIFSRHGIPKLVYSDNGSQYTAFEFKEFAKKWDFSHITLSPFFPQSNGLVERTIQTVKRTMKKAHESKQDILMALLVLNTTPDKEGISHAERLFNRKLRTSLPSGQHENFIPVPGEERVNEATSKGLPDITPGTTVRIRTDKDRDWGEQGKVVRKREEPRSYDVLNQRGNVVRRNRRHLIPTRESFISSSPDEVNETCDKSSVGTIPITPTSNEDVHSSDTTAIDDNKYKHSRSGRVIRIPQRYRE